MNLDEWKLRSGAYMPIWEDRIDYAIAHLEQDLFGRVPAWLAAYNIGKNSELFISIIRNSNKSEG